MLHAPMAGLVVEVLVDVGSLVSKGQVLFVLEAMKMEHEVCAPFSAKVLGIHVARGQMLDEGALLAKLSSVQESASADKPELAQAALPKGIRADLAALLARTVYTLDSARPAVMKKRRSLGMQSARENIAQLCDADSFVEYGGLAFAAQTLRRPVDDLIANTPADGIVTGVGKVDGITCAVFAYDMTVLAGTQGMRSHEKTDRLLALALQRRWPVVLFAEGGGGRPGDTDMPIIAGLNVATFATFAKLSGTVPLIGIVAGRCFAGNAALLGCCDFVISTANSNIGMGGPAMVEGGGLGVFAPEDIGPSHIQFANGVIDVLVTDEAAAITVAKALLSYATKSVKPNFESPDQLLLGLVVPENRLRSYDVQTAINLVFDTGSVLVLQAGYGQGIVTAFARLNGRPLAVIANNPQHLGGAIDPQAADKLANFFALCNQYDLPIVSFVDTPGFMVGPDVEALAQVRYASQLFVAAAKLTVPLVAVVLRKAYGLGAMAMTGGGFHEAVATMSWPSAEFGAMGLEGSVRLGYKKELAQVLDNAKRDELFNQLLAKQYEEGKAIRMAETLEIDAVINPVDTRKVLASVLQ
jgi:acetyl-CoA carboxylase carboxyltransferase component